MIYYRNQAEVAKVLIEAKANVEYKNNLGLFPLVLATTLGHYDVMRVLTRTSQGLNTKVNYFVKWHARTYNAFGNTGHA